MIEVLDSWIADSFNINTYGLASFLNFRTNVHTKYRWMIVSSMVQSKLSWWQAWICVWIGYGVVAPFIVLNARPGAKFHVTFPVVARTSFGLYGSLWCTFNRGAMAWYVGDNSANPVAVPDSPIVFGTGCKQVLVEPAFWSC